MTSGVQPSAALSRSTLLCQARIEKRAGSTTSSSPGGFSFSLPDGTLLLSCRFARFSAKQPEQQRFVPERIHRAGSSARANCETRCLDAAFAAWLLCANACFRCSSQPDGRLAACQRDVTQQNDAVRFVVTSALPKHRRDTFCCHITYPARSSLAGAFCQANPRVLWLAPSGSLLWLRLVPASLASQPASLPAGLL